MKKDQKNPTAATAAQTVKNDNGTPNQPTTAAQTVETPQSDTVTPTAETETTPETVTVNTAAETLPTPTQAPKVETIEEFNKRLENELSRLNHKKTLARNREKFIDSMGSLQLYIDQLKNEDEFETKSGKITFQVLTSDNYNRANFTDAFSISNTALISKFCYMLQNEMQQKIASLELELLSA